MQVMLWSWKHGILFEWCIITTMLWLAVYAAAFINKATACKKIQLCKNLERETESTFSHKQYLCKKRRLLSKKDWNLILYLILEYYQALVNCTISHFFTIIWMKLFNKTVRLIPFSCTDVLYIWNHISHAWFKVKPTLVVPHSPNGFGKVPFAQRPSNWTNIGDIYKKKDSHIS